jgi:hypothetical protein
MKETNCLIIVLGLLLAISCKKPSKSQLSDGEIWKLGWSLIENSMDDKLLIAESQFVTLLSLSKNIDRKFLITGLEIKSKLNKNEEIKQLISSQEQETLNELCKHDFLKGSIHCEDLKEVRPKNEILQLEIIKMYINDQYVRSNLMEDVLIRYNLVKNEVIVDSFGVNTDERNRNRLKEIIDELGFPTKAMVGKDAMNGIFYIIQHSDGDKIWQKSQLSNIKKSVKVGDMDGQSYAYLYDRIKVNSGEKQLYGTQFSNVNPSKRTVTLAETKDLETLDKRRMEIGMMPIEMYKRVMLKNG